MEDNIKMYLEIGQRLGLVRTGLERYPVTDCCEHYNAQKRIIFDSVSNFQLVIKDPAPWSKHFAFTVSVESFAHFYGDRRVVKYKKASVRDVSVVCSRG
jgi:hypothetical protein